MLGIGAVSGHHEHRSPSTRVATEARGWRSTLRRSIARLAPQPGQNTSSQGVPAISAARSRVGVAVAARRRLTETGDAASGCQIGAVAVAAQILLVIAEGKP